MAIVHVRVRARRDILDTADYLEAQGGIELALRFVNAARTTFEALAVMPKMGALCAFDKPVLRHVRCWRIDGFENWLIFYQTKRDGIEIIHVLHGARDIKSLFGG